MEMDSNEYPKALHQTADRHLVALSADYTPNKTAFVHADMRADGAILTRYNRDFNLDFKLTPEEADAFVDAWTAYRATQRQSEEDEVQRITRVTEQAYVLASKRRAIDIVTDEDSDSMWVC